MIGLVQRVACARVEVDTELVGEIGRGALVFIGVQKGDDEKSAQRLLDRLLGYRIFPDEQGRMNLSLTQVGAGLFLVPQFTLAADTRRGTRAGFSRAATPEDGRRLFEYLARRAQSAWTDVVVGRFGADMQVSLINDGPVTFWLES